MTLSNKAEERRFNIWINDHFDTERLLSQDEIEWAFEIWKAALSETPINPIGYIGFSSDGHINKFRTGIFGAGEPVYMSPRAAARAQGDAEPVAWVAPTSSGCFYSDTERGAILEAQSFGATLNGTIPLYTHPPSAGVPEGVVPVPVELAEQLITDAESWHSCFGEPDKGDYYAAFVDLQELISQPPKQEGK